MTREMKDSGVEWIGDIPLSWDCDKVEVLFEEVTKKNFNGQQTKALQFKYGTIIPKKNFDSTEEYVAKVIRNYTVVDKGTLVLNGLNLNYDFVSKRVAIVNEKGAITSAYITFKPRSDEIDSSFANYMFKTYDECKAFHNMGGGVRKILNFGELKKNYFPCPNKTEQLKIVNFLDKKCSEIDSLASDIEKQISVLENYKKSIITETVTKGLNPNVEMKDSGVEWIGKIPSNWNKARLKDLCSFGKGLSITKADLCQDGEPVISYGQIHSKTNISTSIKEDLIRFVPSKKCEFCKVSLCSVGDFIFADTSEDKDGCGNFIYVDRKNVFAGYHTIILKSLITPTKFLSYLFQSDDWRYQIRLSANGIKVFSITQKILSSTTVVLPPLREQVEITNYLDKKCSEIDSLISEKKESHRAYLWVKTESYAR